MRGHAVCMFLGVETQDPKGGLHPTKATSLSLSEGGLRSYSGHPEHPEGCRVVKMLRWSLLLPYGAPHPRRLQPMGGATLEWG